MSMDDLLADCERNHDTLLCKATHAVGIPRIALSIAPTLFRPMRAFPYFGIGAGHALDGKTPPTWPK